MLRLFAILAAVAALAVSASPARSSSSRSAWAPGCSHYCDWVTNTDGVRVPCGETHEGWVEFVDQWTGEYDRCTYHSPSGNMLFSYTWDVAGYIG